MKICGAWVTDVDDTVIMSGNLPTNEIISTLSGLITELKKRHVLWVAMSGVAMAKIGSRLLYKLPEELLDNIVYYAGDGSQSFTFNPGTRMWVEDNGFRRIFSDAQALAVLGENEFIRQFKELSLQGRIRNVKQKLDNARTLLQSTGYNTKQSILDKMKEKLRSGGFEPSESETYFRGGSVSWMMLGDISAEPYRTEKAVKVRKELLSMAESLLADRNFLSDIGEGEIHVPFPGARGIKFVLNGNNKERAMRYLIKEYDIRSREILFIGNELFAGGNDNMIRNIADATLLSVTEGEDPGENVVSGHFQDNGSAVAEVEANLKWMDWAGYRMKQGYPWEAVIHTIRLHGASVLKNRNMFYRKHNGWIPSGVRKKSHRKRQIDVLYFDKGGTLSRRVPLKDNGRSFIKEIMKRVGAEVPVDEFLKMLDERNKIYKKWSVDNWLEPCEEEIWTRFMLPDYPVEIVRYHAQELVLLYSHSKGLRQFKPEAKKVIEELSGRGYRLGAVTNTISKVLVPGELDDAGIADYIETLVMSSVTGIRKPDPRLFLLAARIMNVEPSRCAYIGDQVDRDAEGPHRAGFGLSVIVRGEKAPFVLDKLAPVQKPDLVVNSLEDLLSILN